MPKYYFVSFFFRNPNMIAFSFGANNLCLSVNQWYLRAYYRTNGMYFYNNLYFYNGGRCAKMNTKLLFCRIRTSSPSYNSSRSFSCPFSIFSTILALFVLFFVNKTHSKSNYTSYKLQSDGFARYNCFAWAKIATFSFEVKYLFPKFFVDELNLICITNYTDSEIAPKNVGA